MTQMDKPICNRVTIEEIQRISVEEYKHRHPDKLTIEDLEDILQHEYLWMSKRMQNRNINGLDRAIIQQLADTIRENEKLHGHIKLAIENMDNEDFAYVRYTLEEALSDKEVG